MRAQLTEEFSHMGIGLVAKQLFWPSAGSLTPRSTYGFHKYYRLNQYERRGLKDLSQLPPVPARKKRQFRQPHGLIVAARNRRSSCLGRR